MQATIQPAAGLLPLRRTEAGALKDLSVLSAACNLPEHIAERQKKRALERLEGYDIKPRIEMPKNLPAQGKGSFVVLTAECEHGAGCYSSLGAIGKPAEKVADEAAKALAAFIASEAVMDEYLADQILLPLSLVPAESEYTTCCVTDHLTTNAEIIRRFVPAEIRIEGEQASRGESSSPAAIRGKARAFPKRARLRRPPRPRTGVTERPRTRTTTRTSTIC